MPVPSLRVRTAGAAACLLLLAGCGDPPSPTDPDLRSAAQGKLDPPIVIDPPIPLGEAFDEELIAVLEPLPNPGGPGDAFGGAVAALEDADGDGVTDLAVAAPRADRVYVFSGETREPLHAFGDPDGETGFFFGSALGAVGDVDGDGRDDLAVGAVGAPGEPPPPHDGCVPGPNQDCPDDPAPHPATGRAFLFSGADGDFLRSLRPDRSAFTFGLRVAAPGDVDGDGVPDVMVSAPFAPGGFIGYGQVFAFSGADGDVIWFRRDPPRCVIVETPVCGWDFPSFGMGLASAPDLDSDGVGDVLVGDPFNASFEEGPERFRDQRQPSRVTALSGATGDVLRVHEEASGEAETGYGGALAALGSSEGGAPGDYVVGVPVLGRVELFDGAAGSPIGEIVSPSDPGSDRFSSTLAAADDYDGDGRPEIWVGAGGSGTVYLVNRFGRVLLTIDGFGTGAPIPLTFTLQLAPTGNLGFDGRGDLLIGDGADDAAYVLRVETPRSLLQEEIARIAAMAVQDVLNRGRARSLDAKVRVSLKGAERGNPKQAAKPLGALVNEVTAYERAQVLTDAQARSLIEPADAVREWIRDTF